MTCTCFEWQTTGAPCSHAIAAILSRKENPQTYTQAFLSLDAFRKTYSNAIFPPEANTTDNTQVFAYPLQRSDNTDRVIPPHASRQSGRPKVRRIRSGVEGPFGGKRPKRCGRC